MINMKPRNNAGLIICGLGVFFMGFVLTIPKFEASSLPLNGGLAYGFLVSVGGMLLCLQSQHLQGIVKRLPAICLLGTGFLVIFCVFGLKNTGLMG